MSVSDSLVVGHAFEENALSSKHKNGGSSKPTNSEKSKNLVLDFSNQITDRSSSVHAALVRKYDEDSTYSFKSLKSER